MTRFHMVLTVLLPPLSVYLKRGASKAFWLNALLTLLGYLPGVVHAFWLQRDGPPKARLPGQYRKRGNRKGQT